MFMAPDDMIGRTFLAFPTDEGQRHRGWILRLVDTSKNEQDTTITVHGDIVDNGDINKEGISNTIDAHNKKLEKNPERIKFICSFHNDKYEEVVTYNEIMRHTEKDDEDSSVWKFRRITAHEGPLNQRHLSYKWSRYNLMEE